MSYTLGIPYRTMQQLRGVALTGALLMLGTASVQAQQPTGRMRTPRYDPTTVQTVAGAVTAVDRTTGRAGLTGIHVDVKTVTGVEFVHLGPEAFVEGKGLNVAIGDQVEIVGSKVTIAGTPVLLAREVRKGGASVALRDSSGFPLWAGQGMRRRVP